MLDLQKISEYNVWVSERVLEFTTKLCRTYFRLFLVLFDNFTYLEMNLGSSAKHLAWTLQQ